MMQSFFIEKGHDPAKCEKLRKETTRLRSQILQYDSKAPSDAPGSGGGGSGISGGGGGGGKGGGGDGSGGKSGNAKKLGDYCIACELARLFEDMFSTEGELLLRLFSGDQIVVRGRRRCSFEVVSERRAHTLVFAVFFTHPRPA